MYYFSHEKYVRKQVLSIDNRIRESQSGYRLVRRLDRKLRTNRRPNESILQFWRKKIIYLFRNYINNKIINQKLKH